MKRHKRATYSILKELLSRMERVAKKMKVKKSWIVATAVAEWLDRRDRDIEEKRARALLAKEGNSDVDVIIEERVVTHKKSGKEYTVGYDVADEKLVTIINTTNENDGQMLVVYQNHDDNNGLVFAREISEFKEKFEVLEA